MARSETTGNGKCAVLYDGEIFIFDNKDFQDGHWITINADEEEGRKGQHVFVRENGTIIYGLGGKFKNLRDLVKKEKGEEYAATKDEVVDFLKKTDGRLLREIADNDIVPFSHKELKKENIDNFLEVKKHKTQPSEDEIIKNLGGADLTAGSCASLALAYTAQKDGWDVLDFRGGESRAFFSSGYNKQKLFKDSIVATDDRTVKGARKLLETVVKKAPDKKEFLLSTGSHMAVVRRNGNRFEYLELQSDDPQWTDFGDSYGSDPSLKLRYRFGARMRKSSRGGFSLLYDCEKLKDLEAFKMSIGFINTEKDKQKKGKGGGIK